MAKPLNPTAQKLLLLLAGGLILGLSRSPRGYFRALDALIRTWKEVDKDAKKFNKNQIPKAFKSLYRSQLIELKKNVDGTFTAVLTKKGEKRVLTYKLSKMKIKTPIQWDRKWRVVLFDIPETHRRGRNAIRYWLKRLNFFEYQKSVFIHPYDCKNEIDFIIEFFNMRPYTRFILADTLDNEKHLENHFKLK